MGLRMRLGPPCMLIDKAWPVGVGESVGYDIHTSLSKLYGWVIMALMEAYSFVKSSAWYMFILLSV